MLLLPAAASVSCVIRGLGPFDTPFESSKTAHDNQVLAAAAPALTRTSPAARSSRRHPVTPCSAPTRPALAENYILYSGREVLPIGGFLGNVPAPTLATLQADISRGYVRLFVLPVSPRGHGPAGAVDRVALLQAAPAPGRRPVPYANFFCGLPAVQPGQPAATPAPPQPAANAATGARTA